VPVTPPPGPALDLSAPVDELLTALVDTPSESGSEGLLADAVEAALRGCDHLEVDRHGDAVVARTRLGRDRRVLLAGHLDTIPAAGNLPSRRSDDGRVLHGLGTSDMKSGVAVQLRLAAALTAPRMDVTYVLYDNEEVAAERNGLLRLVREARPLLDADLAVLLEPTSGEVEAGCQGTLRVQVRLTGRRAHSARSWLGENAIHRAAPVLAALAAYEPRQVTIDGCTYREGLNAVLVSGGVAGNVVPDECVVTVNHRFAPDRSEADALRHVREVLAPHEVVLTDSAPGALPGLAAPAAQEFVAAVQALGGGEPVAKYGWTDVARFAELGIPAVNFGPGDPSLAHTREEHVELARVERCEQMLRAFLV
jgi:succinyl-diaminopimelate desuccinylase